MDGETNVDHPTLIELCSGYGGLGLGLERVLGPCRHLAHVEIESFAAANLVSKMEAGTVAPCPVWSDVKTFPAREFHGVVDIITGGYPCQPFSVAGKGLGTEDPRHLWPWIRVIIDEILPRYVFLENVAGHVKNGLDSVWRDLRDLGYHVEAGIFGAWEVGASHQRNRLFILAHAQHLRELQQEGGQPNKRRRLDNCGEQSVAHGNGAGLEEYRPEGLGAEGRDAQVPRIGGAPCPSEWPAGPGPEQYEWEPPRTLEPGVGRGPDGCAHRIDRIRMLGNGVVPAQAAFAFRSLLARMTDR